MDGSHLLIIGVAPWVVLAVWFLVFKRDSGGGFLLLPIVLSIVVFTVAGIFTSKMMSGYIVLALNVFAWALMVLVLLRDWLRERSKE